MFHDIIFALLAALCWAVCVQLEKHHLLKYFKPYELLVLKKGIVVILLIYLLTTDIGFYNKVRNMNGKITFYFLTEVMLGLIALFLFWKVLKSNKSGIAVSIVHPLLISLVVMTGFYFYKEKMNYYEMLGIAIIIMGVLILNFNKST